MNLEEVIKKLDILGFLKGHPTMSILPIDENNMVKIGGLYSFARVYEGHSEVRASYELEISVAEDFPRSLPIVKETEGKIPTDGDHHINGDKSVCVGSPMRVLSLIGEDTNLESYAHKCLEPYLYAVTLKLRGERFPWGELAHGADGLLIDYKDLLGLDSPQRVESAMEILSLSKKVANKKQCPCGCGKRVGKCLFRKKLSQFRRLAPRSWYRNHLNEIQAERAYIQADARRKAVKESSVSRNMLSPSYY